MGERVIIIAEAGVNHNGSLDLAKKLVRVAASAGADMVKFQTFVPNAVIARGTGKAIYQSNNTGSEEDQLEMVSKLALSKEDHHTLAALATMLGITFISTPFDNDSVDFLDVFKMPFIKIPSGEITNKRHLEYVASKGVPVVMSTGMSEKDEIQQAVDVLLESGLNEEDITLLKCTTAYPTDYQDANLSGMLTLRNDFGTKVGYSDHTLGIEVPIAACALGAVVIEKHFTMDRTLEGPDHKASIEPQEFAQMTRAIRNIEQAMGSGLLEPTSTELENRVAARRSIHAASDLSKGTTIRTEHLVMKRPGDGISPFQLDELIGRKLTSDLLREHKLRWEDFE